MQLWQSEVSAPVAEGLQVVAGESGDGMAGAWMALESVRHVRIRGGGCWFVRRHCDYIELGINEKMPALCATIPH